MAPPLCTPLDLPGRRGGCPYRPPWWVPLPRSKFGIPPEVLGNYLAAIGGRYHANPYHNFNHGVHVLVAAWLLTREQLRHNDDPSTTRHGQTIPISPLQVAVRVHRSVLSGMRTPDRRTLPDPCLVRSRWPAGALAAHGGSGP